MWQDVSSVKTAEKISNSHNKGVVDISSDIINKTARINGLKRHGIDCSDVSESPCSHAMMPKNSSETSGPEGTTVKLDSVDGPGTDIRCSETEEANKNSHNKCCISIVADVVNTYSSIDGKDKNEMPNKRPATSQNSLVTSHVDKEEMGGDGADESFSYIPDEKTIKTSRNVPFGRSLNIALNIARNNVHTVNENTSMENESSSCQGRIKCHQMNGNDARFQSQRNVHFTGKFSGDIHSAEGTGTNAMSDNGGIVYIIYASIASGASNAEDRTSRNVILSKESRKHVVNSREVEDPCAGTFMDTKSIMYLKRFIKKKSTSFHRGVETNLPRCHFCKIAFTRWALVRHHEKSVHKSQVSRKKRLSMSANESSSCFVYSIPLRFVSSFNDTISHSSQKTTKETEWKDLEFISKSEKRLSFL